MQDIFTRALAQSYEPSLADQKKDQLDGITAEKQRRLDPNAAGQNAVALAAQKLRDSLAMIEADRATSDPNSTVNQGKAFTADELSDTSFFDPKQIANNALGSIKKYGEVVGDVLSTPNNYLSNFYGKQIDDSVRSAYSKEKAGDTLSTEETALLDTHQNTDRIYDPYQKQFIQNTHVKSNRELAQLAEKHSGIADKVEGVVNKVVSPLGDMYNSERNPNKESYDVLGGMEDYATMLKDIPTQTKGAIGQMLAGGDDPETITGVAKQWMDEADTLNTQRKSETTPDQRKRKIIPLPDFLSENGALTRGDVQDTSQSTGFTIASMAATILGSISGGGATPSGVIAGMAAAGTAAYRMDKAGITKQVLDAAETARGQKLTGDERKKLLEETDSLRSNHALWEAGPEAIGNALGMVGFGKVFQGISSSFVPKFMAGLMVGLAGETSTEVPTQIGQNIAEHDLGLASGDKMSFGKFESYGEALKEVFPSVLALSGTGDAITATAAKVENALANKPQLADSKLTPEVTAATAKLNERQGAVDAAKQSLQNATDLQYPHAKEIATEHLASMETQLDTAKQDVVNAKAEVAKQAIVPNSVAPATLGTKIAKGVEKIITPKSEITKKYNKINEGKAAVSYPTKLKEAVESGNVDAYANTTDTTNYNPVLAVEALSKINEKESTTPEERIKNIEKAREITEDFTTHMPFDRIDELKAIEKPSKVEATELKDLEAAAVKIQGTYGKLNSQVIKMGEAPEASTEDITTLSAMSTSEDADAIDSAVMSTLSKTGTIGSVVHGSSLAAIAKNPNTRPETKALIESLQAFDGAKQELLKPSGKSSDVVMNNILQGGDGNKGINTFMSNIPTFIQAGNTNGAVEELSNLTAFAKAHKDKVSLLRAMTTGNASPDVKKQFNEMNARLKSKGQKTYFVSPNSEKWHDVLNNMDLEVSALDAAVVAASNMVKIKAPTIKATAPTATTAGTAAQTTQVKPVETKQSTATVNAPVETTPTTEKQSGTKADTVPPSVKTVETTGTKVEEKPVDAQKTESVSDKVEPTEDTQEVVKNKVGTAASLVKSAKEKAETVIDVTKYHSLNIVREFFSAFKQDNNKLHTEPNFLTKLSEAAAKFDFSSILPEADTAAAHLMSSLSNFISNPTNGFDKSFKEIHKDKSLAYRHRDAIQYLHENGFNDLVVGSMGAVAYKWLASRSKETLLNDEQAIRDLLDVNNDEHIPGEAYRAIRELGQYKDNLADDLGGEIYRLIGIKPDKKAPYGTDDRLKKSLGAMAMATLQKMDLLEENKVYTGIIDKPNVIKNSIAKWLKEQNSLPANKRYKYLSAVQTEFNKQLVEHNKIVQAYSKDDIINYNDPFENQDIIDRFAKVVPDLRDIQEGFGLAGLKAFVKDGKPYNEHRFKAAENSIDRAGRPVTEFYRVKTEKYKGKDQVSADIDLIQDKWLNAPDTWAELFSSDPDSEVGYSWKKFTPKDGWLAKIKGTAQKATREQTDNQLNNENRPYVRSKPTMDVFLLLGLKNQLRAMGHADPTKEHKELRDGIITKNASYERGIQYLHEWIKAASQRKDGLNSPFYIPASIWRNMRMGQVGHINPQNDKTHRYLFGMKGYTSTFDLGDKEAVKHFMLGIALALDVEPSKNGGAEETLTKLKAKLASQNDTRIMDAVNAVSNILSTIGSRELTDPAVLEEIRGQFPDEIETILTGVEAGKANIHSFKGIVELARFLQATGGDIENAPKGVSFTTDLPAEIDGISNGPIIGRIQLFMRGVTARKLAMLRSGGIHTSDKQGDVGEFLYKKQSLDVYKMGGAALADALHEHESNLITELKSSLKTKDEFQKKLHLTQYMTLKRMFDDVTDKDGYLTKSMRSIMKSPTMTTVYGAGSTSVIQKFADQFIEDKIYGELKRIANDVNGDSVERGAALSRLEHRVNTIANLFKENEKHKLVIDINSLTVDGKLSAEKILNITLSKQTKAGIHKAIQFNQGKALAAAINTMFGDVIDARTHLNKGYSLNTALYNAALYTLIDRKMAELEKAGKRPVLEEPKGKPVVYADLSIEDYEAIEAQIKDIYPTATTPFGGVMEMAKRDRTKDYSENDSNMVEQTYKNPPKGKGKHISGKNMYISYRKGLADPGVSPMVLLIQMLDATISNRTQGGLLDLLNVHDGFFSGVLNMLNLNKDLNMNMYNTMKDYDLAQGMYESVKAAHAAYTKLVDSRPEDPTFKDDLKNTLNRVMIGNNVLSPEQMDSLIIDGVDLDVLILEILGKMEDTTKSATEGKKELFSLIDKINHYYYPDGGFSPNAKDTSVATSQKIADNIDTTNAAEVDAKAEKGIAASKAFYKELAELTNISEDRLKNTDVTLKSSETADPLSEDEQDYDLVDTVEKGNVVDTYNILKDHGHKKDSIAHDMHLNRILSDIVSGIMTPVEVFHQLTEDSETAGIINTGTNKVFLRSHSPGIGPVSGALNQGIVMSTGETYAHELVHAITHHALNMQPAFRKNVQRLYDLAKENLTYRNFLSNPNTTDQYEIQAAKDRFNYIFVDPPSKKVLVREEALSVVNEKEYLLHLDEFMSLGLTNEPFYKALQGINLNERTQAEINRSTWAGIKGNNIQDLIVNLFSRIVDAVFHTFSKNLQTGNVASELEYLTKNIKKVDSKYKTIALNVLRKAAWANNKVGTFVNKRAKKILSKMSPSRVIDPFNRLIDDMNSPSGQVLREMRQMIDDMEHGFAQSVIQEVRGLTPRLAKIHSLISKKSFYIDAAREEVVNARVNFYSKLWDRELSTVEKKHVLKAGVKSDLSVLLGDSSMQEIADLLDANGTTLDTAITDLHRQLNTDAEIQPYVKFYEKQAQSLGYFMAHSRSLVEVQMLNAYNIARMSDSKYAKDISMDTVKRVEKVIDKLATLYSIKFTDASHRNGLKQLIAENSAAVEQILISHAEIKATSKKHLFQGNSRKIIKGYTKDIVNSQVTTRVAPLSAKAELEAEGFTISKQFIGRDNADPDKSKHMYLYSSKTGSVNNLQATLITFTGNRAKGVNSRQAYLAAGEDVNQGNRNDLTIKQKKRIELDNMFVGDMVPFDGKEPPNYMIPQVDDMGKITKYRYVMAESTKDNLLEKHNDYDAVLASMYGQVLEKTRSSEVNEDTLRAFKDMYDTDGQSRPNYYVEISPYTTNDKHRELYYRLPGNAKKAMLSIWGGDRMFVAKDVVDLAFGTYKYSIAEAFEKDSVDRNLLEKAIVELSSNMLGDKKITTMLALENALIGMTKIAKNNIIVRSLSITLGNFMSNVLYMKGRGVGMIDIVNGIREATTGVLKYQADKKALDQAKIKLEVSKMRTPQSSGLSQATLDTTNKELELVVRQLNDKIARNHVTASIDAGLLQSIVDDVETSKIQSPYKSDLAKKIDGVTDRIEGTGKAGTALVTAGKTLLLSNDTKAYKVLNNAVKMTDFIGRYIMYKHYTSPARGNKQLDHKTAVAQVIHEFVDFNLPTHRMLEYGNAIGLVWFSKYALRILKPVKNMIADDPYAAVSSLILSNHFNLDSVGGSILGISRNPIDMLGNPLSALIESGGDVITTSLTKDALGM
jgi:hypothetical protein